MQEAASKQLIGGAHEPTIARVRGAVEPIVADAGLELLGAEFSQEGHRRILWVYIDAPAGVTIDDCARVSPEVSAALDVEDPVADRYELRVSSPGLDRPLMSDRDFAAYAGREATVHLGSPLGGRRKFSGTLRGVAADAVQIECSDGTHDVPLNLIQRARLKYELPKQTKTGGRRRKKK